MDTILNLIRLAGDYVSEEVWYRIIQIVINKQEVQGYSAKTCFEVSLPSVVCLLTLPTNRKCCVILAKLQLSGYVSPVYTQQLIVFKLIK